MGVLAGTATSTRTRGEDNSFNVLHIEAGRVRVERYRWNDGAFVPCAMDTFCRRGDKWQAGPA